MTTCPCIRQNIIRYQEPVCNSGCGVQTCYKDDSICIRAGDINTYCLDFSSVKPCDNTTIIDSVVFINTPNANNTGTLAITSTTNDNFLACFKVDALASVESDRSQITATMTDSLGNVYNFCFNINTVKTCA